MNEANANVRLKEEIEGSEMRAMHTEDMEELKSYMKNHNLWVREAAMSNKIATDEMIRERLEIEIEPNVQIAGVMNPNASHDTVLYAANVSSHDDVKIACLLSGKLTLHDTSLIFKNNPRLEKILEQKGI